MSATIPCRLERDGTLAADASPQQTRGRTNLGRMTPIAGELIGPQSIVAQKWQFFSETPCSRRRGVRGNSFRWKRAWRSRIRSNDSCRSASRADADKKLLGDGPTRFSAQPMRAVWTSASLTRSVLIPSAGSCLTAKPPWSLKIQAMSDHATHDPRHLNHHQAVLDHASSHCAERVRNGSPVFTFQSTIVLSGEETATVRPSPLQATAETCRCRFHS